MGAISVGMGLISGQRMTPGKPLLFGEVAGGGVGQVVGAVARHSGRLSAGGFPVALSPPPGPRIIFGIMPPMVMPMASRTVSASPRNARGMLLGGLGWTPREASAKTVARAAPAANEKPARAG